MFAKLLKYEWKATAKTLGFLSLAALGVGVLGTLDMRFMITSFNSDTNPLLAVISTFLLIGTILTLIVYAFAVTILLLARFYRNKFTDEGYLTFTLPVSSHQLVLSTALNMFFWSLISSAVLLCAFFMIFFIGTAETGLFNQEILDAFRMVFDEFSYAFESIGWNAGTTVLAIAALVASMLESLFLPIAAVTMGASLAKKHKILAAFGIFYGINMVCSIFSSATSAFGSALTVSSASLQLTNNLNLVFGLVTSLVIAVGSYLLTTWMMNKKLNLS